MCSISWQFQGASYDLFFTRDEQRSRAAAEAPSEHTAPDGLRYLAPTDPRGGGTWIFVNARGLSGTLLNAYALGRATPALEQPSSRGQLVGSLAGVESIQGFGDRLAEGIAHHSYPPCYLFAFAPGGDVGFWLWDGHQLRDQTVPASQFFTTSSVRPVEVCNRRAAALQRELGPPPYAPEALEHFHRDESGQCTSEDLRMSRPDARSVSLTHIRCRPEALSMTYAPRDRDGPFGPGMESRLLPRK